MGGCSCENQDAMRSAARKLLKALNSFWPPGMPYPPRAPWLISHLSREQAVALVRPANATSGKISSIRKAEKGASGASYQAMAADGADTDCQDCPDGSCWISDALPEMAADWYDAGGFAQDIVVMLYDLLGQEFCEESGACEDDADSDLVNCRYECLNIYWAYYHGDDGWHAGYVYEFKCCCDVQEADPGPGPGFPRGGFPFELPEILGDEWDPGHGGL